MEANMNQMIEQIVKEVVRQIGGQPGGCDQPAHAELAKYIDHTVLYAYTTRETIARFCDEAMKYHFAAVCFNPIHVAFAKQRLAGSNVKVATVIGFPLGANTPVVKAFETKDAIANGVDEVDMVINIGAAKEHNWDLVREDMKAVIDAARESSRYIKVKVFNDDQVEREVEIIQYPLEYIINIQSWYSYRDDFKTNNARPTTYEYMGDRIYGISLATGNISSWNGQYDYEASERSGWWGETNTSSGFFRSKFVSSVTNGKSTILHYYWNSREQRETSSTGEYNGRLYHIRLTATSNKYTVGRPRLIEDESNPGLMVTDPGKDNAQLVSPSFMIASSLGGFMLGAGNLTLDDSDNSLRVAREHCANYVEVAEDGTVYDDWRLPTEAELKIIMDFQGTENADADAIDYLLNAAYYYSASGRVSNSKNNMNGTGVRCVRDVYHGK